MRIDRRLIALAALPLLLTGCEHEFAGIVPPQSASFGEANHQTMMAQVVDPDPHYDTLIPPTSAEHADQAAERYNNDKVKQPERITSTQTSGGGGH